MKKYVIYSGILVVGLLLGWLLFGNSSNEKTVHEHSEMTAEKQMWTCSMHPQIKQPEAGDCPICGMDLTPVDTNSETLSEVQFKLTKNALALASVQTTVVGMGAAKKTITVSGKIVENEKNNSVQTSYFDGRLEKLNVNFEGQKVTQGQLLATIYSPTLIKTQQELLSVLAIKEKQPALYESVRNKLKLLKVSENQINQIEESGRVNEFYPIYATVSGTVIEKLVEVGDYIKKGQSLFQIANLNSVWGDFDVYENQIDLFKKGQEVLVETNAYPNKKYKAKVDFINPILDIKTRTVTLRVVLNNQKETFKPGMFVTAKIARGKVNNKEVMTIPASAILWTGKRSIVYVKPNQDTPVFEMREVLLANKIGDFYEVVGGLQSGEEVVTNGVFTVDAAAQLKGKTSMMNHVKTIKEKQQVSKKFNAQFQRIYNGYIDLKKAFVESDVKVAEKIATNLHKEIKQLDEKYESDENSDAWKKHFKEMLTSTQNMISEKDLEVQRKAFKILSGAMINVLKTIETEVKTYVFYCPMVENNKGGFWLSDEKKVINPYYGVNMLNCGELSDEMK